MKNRFFQSRASVCAHLTQTRYTTALSVYCKVGFRDMGEMNNEEICASTEFADLFESEYSSGYIEADICRNVET